MRENIATIGVKFDSTDLERGKAALEAMAASGPKVEASMRGVEGALGRTGKSLATLGQGSRGLADIGRDSATGAQGVDRLSQSAGASERSLRGMEGAAGQAGRSLQGLGQNTRGLADVGRNGAAGAAGLDRLAQSSATSDRAMRAATSAASGLSLAVGGLAAGFGLSQLAGITDAYTKYTAQLKIATQTTAAFADANGEVQRIAKLTQGGLAPIGTLYARITASTREMGIAQKDVAKITETVGLSLKVGGASAQEAASTMLQLSQAFGAGRLNGQEFAAVAEAAPGLLNILAESLGKTRGQLKAMSEAGELTTEAMARAFSNEAVTEGLRSQAKEINTISGAFTTLRDEVLLFVGASAQSSGAVSLLTSGISSVAGNINTLAAAGVGFAAAKIAETLLGIGMAAKKGVVDTIAYAQALNAQRTAAIAAAEAEVASGAAMSSRLALTQSMLALSRQEAIASLQSANATVFASQAQINAARSAGALSFALALVRDGEIALAAATQARAAATAELAILGQQQVRLSAQITAATAAQTAAQTALAGATAAGGAAAGLASRALGFLGGPIGIITTLLGLGATAWLLWGSSAKKGAEQAEQSVLERSKSITDTLRAEIALIDKRNAALNYRPKVQGDSAQQEAIGAIQQELEKVQARKTSSLTEEATKQTEINKLLAARGGIEQALAEKATKAAQEADRRARADAGPALQEVMMRQAGVSKNYLSDLKALEAGYKAGEISLKGYTDAVETLAKTTYKNSTAGKESAESAKAGAKAAKAGATEVRQASTAYASLITSIEQKIEAERAELSGVSRLSASQRERIKLDADIAAGKSKLRAADVASARARLDELEALEQQNDAAKEAMKVAVANAAARSKEADSIAAWMLAQDNAAAASLKSANERIDALAQEETAARLAAASSITLAEAVERTTLARLREKQDGFRQGSEGYEALQKEIAARERIIELVSEKGQREALEASNKAQVQEWEATVKQYDDIFRQGFADMLNKGEEGWKSFTKSLRTTFKTAVADQIYKEFARPFVVKIVASLLGITGGAAGGLANAATGSGSSLLSTASNIAGLAGAAGSFGFGASTGASMLMSGQITQAVSLGVANVMGAGGAGIAAGLGTIAGALGPVALGVGALFSIIKKFDNSGTLHMGAGAIYSADKGLRGGQDLYYSGSDKFGMAAKYNPAAQGNVDSIARGIGMALDSVAVSFGQKAGYEIATAFADDSSKDGAWGQLRISQAGKDLMNWEETRKSKWAPKEFGNGDAGYKEYLAAVAKDTRQVLLDMDLPSWANSMLNSIGEAADMDALTGVIGQIAQIQSAFEQMGRTIDGFAELSGPAFEALMKASGGMEALSASAAGYYDSYYSEAERMGKATAQLTIEFAKAGIGMPRTKEAYRALVEEQLRAGEGGAALAAKLLQLAPAFATTADYAAQAALAIEEAFANISKTTAQSVRDVQLSIMDNAQKYSFLDSEINSLIGQLSNATLPDEIERLFNQANQATTSAYGLLDPDEQRRLNSQFVDRLYELEAISQSRLDVAGPPMVEQQAQAAADAKAAAAEQRAAAAQMAEAAAEMFRAAQESMRAAQTPRTIEVRVQGGGKAANEVTFA